jgi:hypothetical protein
MDSLGRKPYAQGAAEPHEPPAQPALTPGLAKANQAPLFMSRSFVLLASSDARWAELFENADIVSEGAPRVVGEQRIYYGCTDIVLPVPCERAGQTTASLAAAVARDPHVRVRALRAARREAAQRAQGPLDRLTAEITVSAKGGGVVVHVEVEGRVFADRRAVPRAQEAAVVEADLEKDA